MLQSSAPSIPLLFLVGGVDLDHIFTPIDFLVLLGRKEESICLIMSSRRPVPRVHDTATVVLKLGANCGRH
jgi:hypothetical protein